MELRSNYLLNEAARDKSMHIKSYLRTAAIAMIKPTIIIIHLGNRMDVTLQGRG